MAHAFRRIGGFVCTLAILAVPAVTHAQTTALYLDSQPGDYIGQGLEQTWTTADLAFTGSSTSSSHVVVSATGSGLLWWTLNFAAPQGTPLAVGTYENATRWPFQFPGTNGLAVNGSGRACNTLFGRFVVHEVELGESGQVVRFAADFEQHCEGRAAALFGAVRLNSTRTSLVPFEGLAIYGLRVESAANGYVTGPGIDCGAGRTDCEEAYDPGSSVTLEAVPAEGYVFLGWAGLDCLGTETVVVSIDRMKSCTPVFNVAPGGTGVEVPDYSANAFFLDGYVDVEGVAPEAGRVKIAHVAPDAALSLFAFFGADEIFVSVQGPRASGWSMTFAAPPGESLAPGTYGPTAVSFVERTDEPLLNLAGANGCFAGGRFIIYELEFSGGSLARFSADFELPCGNPVRLVAGSVRFNASRSSLLPFDGDYGKSTLEVIASLGGYVTASGIDCGDGGRVDCQEVYGPSLVTLQAHPSTGYDFLGWAGQCSGIGEDTTIVMDRWQTCLAVFVPAQGSGAPADPSFALGTLVLDYPGATQAPLRQIFAPPDAIVQRSPSVNAVSLVFVDSSGQSLVEFSVPSRRIMPGEYLDAHNVGSLSGPGMFVPRCVTSVGNFTVYQADYDEDGFIAAFAADFEAFCGSATRPYVAGSVRFNSSRPSIRPFEGAYPRYRLILDPSPHGQVSGPGIDCGAGMTDCTEQYESPGVVALQAIPLAGYRFLGWTGPCQGGSYLAIEVDRTRHCGAVFGATHPGTVPQDERIASNALLVASVPGEPVGQGVRELMLDANISIGFAADASHLSVVFTHHDGRVWLLNFSVPAGNHLAPGTYDGAGHLGASDGPGLAIRRFNPSGTCASPQDVSGRFVIHELTLVASTVTALALDFEHRCSPATPALAGSIRYESNRKELRPFAPQTPAFTRFDLSGDARADLLWQNRQDGRLWLWHMSGATHTFNEPISAPAVNDTNWHIVGSADGNADGYADLYWQHQTTGALAIWYMRETELLSADPLSPGTVADTNWKVRTVADMDDDGHPDLIWQHVVSGDLAVWLMNGRQQRRGESLGPGPVTDVNWTIVGAGDANRDGSVDLYWHHLGTGDIAVWFMRGRTLLSADPLSPSRVADTSWRFRGVTDLDGNGSPDLLWQHLSTLQVGVWLMNGIHSIDGRLVDGQELLSAGWHLVSPR